MKRTIPIALLSLLAAGCVTSSKFHEQESETQQYEQKAGALSTELDGEKAASAAAAAAAAKTAQDLGQQISDLKNRVKDLTDKLQASQQAQTELQASVASQKTVIENEKAQLVGAQDLAQKLASSDDEAASLRDAKDAELTEALRRLNTLLDEKKAFEKSNEEALRELREKIQPAASKPAVAPADVQKTPS